MCSNYTSMEQISLVPRPGDEARNRYKPTRLVIYTHAIPDTHAYLSVAH